MELKVLRGSEVSSELAAELATFYQEVYSLQRSAIPLLRSKEELIALFTHQSTVLFLLWDKHGVAGLADLFPSTDLAADTLMPWVDFRFFREELRGLPWYISVLAIRQDRRAAGYAARLMRKMRGWAEQAGLRIVGFDCNVRHSALVPLLGQRITGWTLFPGRCWALIMMAAGLGGVDTNPVWYLIKPGDKEALGIVESAVKPKGSYRRIFRIWRRGRR